MNRQRRTKSVSTVPFDAAEFLADDETQLAYLNAALAEGNAQAMVAALGTVARARGMSRVAERSGLGRESLYKALSDSGNPLYDADFFPITDRAALAVQLQAIPGIVEHGIFPAAMVERVVVAGDDAVRELIAPAAG